MNKWIAGYSDEVSVHAGDTVSFMVSAFGVATYDVDIVHIVCGEDDPRGPGLNMPVVGPKIAQRVPARVQPLQRGSYGRVQGIPTAECLAGDFTVAAFIFPTTPAKGVQTILALSQPAGGCVLRLYVDAAGAIAAGWRDCDDVPHTLSTGIPLRAYTWYLVSLAWNSSDRQLTLKHLARPSLDAPGPAVARTERGIARPSLLERADVMFAACVPSRNSAPCEYFNGKIDTPALLRECIHEAVLKSALETPQASAPHPSIAFLWDFSQGTPSSEIVEIQAKSANGYLVNLPTRAVTGWNWTGEENNWRMRPSHYRAIHFHDDDLYDAGWAVDFTYIVPPDLPSGVYAAHLIADGSEEYIPFAVRPARGSPKNSVAFLVPDASYMAYANYLEHTKTPEWFEPYLGRLIELNPTECLLLEHPEFDGCLYSVHSDGSGFHYSSRLRPILNMRPKFRSALGGDGCGAWQFKADTHIWAWLDHIDCKFDVVCDQDLDREGLAALDGYQVLVTGTHPEYVSARMRAALEEFIARDGRLMYLGGNGFYWKVAYDQSHPGVIELRRGDSGSRAWASRPGESYMAFGPHSSGLGGLWRNSGQAPNTLTGVGFTAQGFDYSAPYRRQPGSYDERAKFIFAGISEEIIGAFGLVGGGAAGLEIDRTDAALGTPAHALVLASSFGHTPHYLLAVEEILEMHPFISGDVSDQVRADLVFWESGGGGAVFATGSIAWAGALSHDGYDNCVARITENVIRRFAAPEAFSLPAASTTPP